MSTRTCRFLATLVKWFVRLIVLVTAFDALGLPAVSVLQQILLWLPNRRHWSCWSSADCAMPSGPGARRDGVRLGNPELLATIAGRCLGLCDRDRGQPDWYRDDHRQHAVQALVGSVAVAFALAFGLGGETAAEIVRNWYEQDRTTRRSLPRQPRRPRPKVGSAMGTNGSPSTSPQTSQPRG